jgi:hypothetical protein
MASPLASQGGASYLGRWYWLLADKWKPARCGLHIRRSKFGSVSPRIEGHPKAECLLPGSPVGSSQGSGNTCRPGLLFGGGFQRPHIGGCQFATLRFLRHPSPKFRKEGGAFKENQLEGKQKSALRKLIYHRQPVEIPSRI